MGVVVRGGAGPESAEPAATTDGMEGMAGMVMDEPAEDGMGEVAASGMAGLGALVVETVGVQPVFWVGGSLLTLSGLLGLVLLGDHGFQQTPTLAGAPITPLPLPRARWFPEPVS